MANTKFLLKQLANSVVPGSLIKTGNDNVAAYMEPGTDGQIISVVNGIPTYVDNNDEFITGQTFNTSTLVLTSITNEGNVINNDLSVLSSDRVITGGTYDSNTGIITYSTNSGTTFDVSGFVTGFTDNFITSGVYNNGTLTLTDNNNDNITITGFSVNTGGGSSDGNEFTIGGVYDSNNGSITFTTNSGSTYSVTGITSSVDLEGYSESGTRAAGDLSVIIGDYDNSNNGTKISITDSTENIDIEASIIRLGENITGTSLNTTYVNNLNIVAEPNLGTGNKVLSRNNNSGEIEEIVIDDITRLTYSELETLKDNGELIPSKQYIITDYVHKYQINGSSSSNIRQTHEVIGVAGAFSQFANVPSDVAQNGDVVTVVSTPPGATFNVGDTFTIVNYFNESFIQFNPQLRQSANIGIELQFEKQRYSNVSGDTTVLDANNKPVLQPNGVINTEVHDGTPYMDMSGVDNPAPIIEEIVVTALDENTISSNAESVTFVGDILEYDFDNNTIDDEDGNQISGVTRNGFIVRRINNKLGIDINKDWRNQRYRRFRVDSDNWTNLLMLGDNADLYTISGRNYGRNINTSLDDAHRYLLPRPEETNFYVDFYSSGNTDVFLSGETSTPPVDISRRSSADLAPQYQKDIILPVNGLNRALDLHIVPIENYEPTDIVGNIKISFLENTVFRDLNQRYGNSSTIICDNINGTIVNSTFNTSTTLYSDGDFRNIKSIESMSVTNVGFINNLFNSNFTNLTNYGAIRNVRLSGVRDTATNNFLELFLGPEGLVHNTVIGIARADAIKLNNSIINRCAILARHMGVIDFDANIYATSINANSNIFATKFNINNYNRQIPNKGLFGTKHIISNGTLNNAIVDDNITSGVLVNRITDSNFITSITQIGTTS